MGLYGRKGIYPPPGQLSQHLPLTAHQHGNVAIFGLVAKPQSITQLILSLMLTISAGL